MTLRYSSSAPLLRYPVVLIHGLGAKKRLGPLVYFRTLENWLKQAGNTVYVANLTSWHAPEYRARELKKQLEEHFPKDSSRLNLVGHSMGGLDARYLASQLQFAHRIASVTTIGTPHRGSPLGDLILDQMPPAWFHSLEKFAQKLGMSHEGFRGLSKQSAELNFNAQVPDAEGVTYFSATTAIPAPALKNALPLFWLPHSLIQRIEGDNDGFVSVESAKWGTFICAHRGDHYAQIDHGTTYYSKRFRATDFYSEIFSRLKSEGF